jgi:hypothetical protein
MEQVSCDFLKLLQQDQNITGFGVSIMLLEDLNEVAPLLKDSLFKWNC